MQCRNTPFPFDANWNFGTDNVFIQINETISTFPPVEGDFQLLDDSPFLLLDGTNFLLL